MTFTLRYFMGLTSLIIESYAGNRLYSQTDVYLLKKPSEFTEASFDKF